MREICWSFRSQGGAGEVGRTQEVGPLAPGEGREDSNTQGPSGWTRRTRCVQIPGT